MTRQELIERIKRHETQCGLNFHTAFGVAEVVELADGVLAVRETDGEYAIYFDKSKCQARGGASKDRGPMIRDFPSDTGFIEDVTSRNWQDMTYVAQTSLKASGHGEINWHKKPVSVKY